MFCREIALVVGERIAGEITSVSVGEMYVHAMHRGRVGIGGTRFA